MRQFIYRYLLVISTVLLSATATATAVQYHVAMSGHDSNLGTSTAPFRTIAQGVSVLQPGDTLLIREGTYRENLRHGYDVIPSGFSWNSPITISAYPGETVVMKPYNGGTVLGLTGGQQYIVIKGIVFDAINCTLDTVAVKSGSHHIRFVNVEIKNAAKNGVLVSGAATNIEFINAKVHSNARAGSGHGLYISTSNNLVDGCEVYRNGGYGIHVYSGSARADHNIVRNNRVWENGTNPDTRYTSAGIILSSGSGNIAYNNIVWNNPNGIEVSWQNPIDAKLFNNTIYGNHGAGIQINYAVDTEVINNISYGNSVNIIDNGLNTNLASNLTTDPYFIDSQSWDFSLQESSPAIDAGIYLSLVDVDIAGQSRPKGARLDIGAYEYHLTPVSAPSPPFNVRAILE